MRNPFLRSSRPADAEPNADHSLVHLHIQDYDKSEVSEFLDESIRMKEQPFTSTEESIGAGSPDNLL